MHIPMLSNIRLSVPQLYMTQYDHISITRKSLRIGLRCVTFIFTGSKNANIF